MPRTFVEFYVEVEKARDLLVEASEWYLVKGEKVGAKELVMLTATLIQWCEDNVPVEEGDGA